MKYKYSGYDRLAKKIDGELDASSEAEARNHLKSMNIRPIRLVQTAQKSAGSSPFSFGSGAPSLGEFTAFIRQLATMQGAGIPIVQSLNVLSQQVENKKFGAVLATVQQNIEEGTNFTDALKKHPKVFDKIFVSLVAAGEMSGALEKVLQRLAIYYEKAAQLRRKILGALTYPVLVILLVITVVMVLMMFVVPTFKTMFESSGKELPGPTQVIVAISNFVRKFWWAILGGFVGTGFGGYWLWTTEEVRRALDPLIMKIPLFGDLVKKVAIARFSRTLATMIQSGVPILDALEITADVAGNSAVESAIKKTKQSISEGNSISAPLIAAKIFPQMAVSMIAIGEQTGALEAMLTKVAEFYEDEVDNKVTAMTSILEPLLIVIVGLVVAGVIIPMYLPIFKLGDTI